MIDLDRKLFIENIGELPGGDSGFTGVYAGSAFCQEALPSRGAFEQLVKEAASRGLSFTFVTPYLTDTYFDHAFALAELLATISKGAEVTANDLGFLVRVAGEIPDLVPVAGRALAGQRTDPQIPAILEAAFSSGGQADMAGAFGHVSVNKPGFADFMLERGVRRLEIQNTKQAVSIGSSDFSYSMHSPYVFVSSTRFCPPVESYVRPGRVAGVYPCSRHCVNRYHRIKPRGSEQEFLYRGNTIYYENPVVEPPEGVDRLVVHRLPS